MPEVPGCSSAAPNLVPDHVCHDRGSVVLDDKNLKPVVEREAAHVASDPDVGKGGRAVCGSLIGERRWRHGKGCEKWKGGKERGAKAKPRAVCAGQGGGRSGQGYSPLDSAFGLAEAGSGRHLVTGARPAGGMRRARRHADGAVILSSCDQI